MKKKNYSKILLLCIIVLLNITTVQCVGSLSKGQSLTRIGLCTTEEVIEQEPIQQAKTYTDVLQEWETEKARLNKEIVSELNEKGIDILLSLDTLEFPNFYKQDFLIAYKYLSTNYINSLSEVPYLDYELEVCTTEDDVTYANVKIYEKSGEELLKEYGYDTVPVEIRTVVLDDTVGVDVSAIDVQIYGQPYVNYILNLSTKESILLQTATSLYGITPYVYGNKPNLYGNCDVTKGLDCSGYVEWVFSNAGYVNSKKVTSTYQILSNCKEIETPFVCSIGIKMKKINNKEINHTGIYVGDGYYIHCNGAKDGVSIDKYPFPFYFSY